MRYYLKTAIIIAPLLFLSCSSSYKIYNRTMNHMIALNGDGSPYKLVSVSDNNRKGNIQYEYHNHYQIPVIDSTSNYYPVYINWESSMFDAYIEQLLYIRQGKYSPTMGPISAPFYLLYDIGRAILRAPITWGHQGYNLLRNSYLYPSVNDTIYKKYNREFYSDGNHIYLGNRNVGFWDDFSSTVTHIISGILKIITTPLLDTFGKNYGNL